MKWGILAAGTIAVKFASTLRAMEAEGEELLAVASRSLVKAEAFLAEHGGKKAYGSYEELMQDEEVEAVYIAAPNNLHASLTRECLLAGKHVLCEKPFTTSAQEAKELYDLAQEQGLFLMEGFWIRFLPLYEKLLSIISAKTYGELRHVRCEYGFIAKGARRERKFLSELGGGALLDIGIYNLGFLHMVMESDPESFTSQVQMSEYGTDAFSAMLLSYPDGRTAQSMQTIGLQMERQAALFFDKASIYIPDFQKAESMLVKPNEGEAFEVHCPIEVADFAYEVREASRCVSEGMTSSDIYTPEDSLAVLELMDEIRESWGMRFSYER